MSNLLFILICVCICVFARINVPWCFVRRQPTYKIKCDDDNLNLSSKRGPKNRKKGNMKEQLQRFDCLYVNASISEIIYSFTILLFYGEINHFFLEKLIT